MSQIELKTVLDDLRRTAAIDFSAARSAPPSMYHHPDLLALEADKIFNQDSKRGRSEALSFNFIDRDNMRQKCMCLIFATFASV
jgi:hypothetical protein